MSLAQIICDGRVHICSWVYLVLISSSFSSRWMHVLFLRVHAPLCWYTCGMIHGTHSRKDALDVAHISTLGDPAHHWDHALYLPHVVVPTKCIGCHLASYTFRSMAYCARPCLRWHVAAEDTVSLTLSLFSKTLTFGMAMLCGIGAENLDGQRFLDERVREGP